MKKFSALLALALAVQFTASLHASIVLSSIPGPDDQGGMIMPMVTLQEQTLAVMFMPPSDPPLLASLAHWSPGDTFQPAAAWYSHLDPVAGAGSLFNNQYGFTFMGSIPAGQALGIRLTAVSSGQIQFWNYSNSQNRFDEVFTGVGTQVLWNGSMWHNYVTLPAGSDAGLYTATFEVFVADAVFTPGTGFVDYTPTALSAVQNMDYETVIINYAWQVVPEPSSLLLAGAGLAALLFRRRKSIPT